MFTLHNCERCQEEMPYRALEILSVCCNGAEELGLPFHHGIHIHLHLCRDCRREWLTLFSDWLHNKKTPPTDAIQRFDERLKKWK